MHGSDIKKLLSIFRGSPAVNHLELPEVIEIMQRTSRAQVIKLHNDWQRIRKYTGKFLEERQVEEEKD